MTTFGFYNSELEIEFKIRLLPKSSGEEIVSRYSELPRREYLFNVINACIANIDSEVKPALKKLEPESANRILIALYNGCIMLNPILDIKAWESMAVSYNMIQDNVVALPPAQQTSSAGAKTKPSTRKTTSKPTRKEFELSKAKLRSMPRWMKDRVIGQDVPIDLIYKALRRFQVGLADKERPLGVYLFAGPSGVGKSYLAKELHKYLFGEDTPMIRIDCGEFQHKHENQRLLGSPVGYQGHEEGGLLARAIGKATAGVVLLDEVEKAHKDFWDTFLKVFDEGYLVDSKGNFLDFRNFIFVLTSNLGNDKVSMTTYGSKTGFTASQLGSNYKSKEVPKREMVVRETEDAIRKFFKPELINRIDDIVVFNHLTIEDYTKVADLEFNEVSKKLMSSSFNLSWTPEASELLVLHSAKAMEGARSMKRIRRNMVEDIIAELLDNKTFPEGKVFEIDAQDGGFTVS